MKKIYKGSSTKFVKKEKDERCEGQTRTTRTKILSNPVSVLSGSSVVGKLESEGPIGEYFDMVYPIKTKSTFEKSEKAMLLDSVSIAAKKACTRINDIELFLSGDLLNQISSSCYAARELGVPFMGIYTACATMAQGLALGSMLLDGGHYSLVAAASSSHFATAERQYRTPLEYGVQRPPYSQWTVTGAGCTILSSEKKASEVKISSVCFGRVVDYGIEEVSNMGAAMAPAVLDTLLTMLKDLGTTEKDYDLIATGDLGKLGSDILRALAGERGIELGKNYADCGAMIFSRFQDCYSGGSGAGCSASVFNSFILHGLFTRKYKRVLFLGSGALMSTTSSMQGETMPAICNGVELINYGEE